MGKQVLLIVLCIFLVFTVAYCSPETQEESWKMIANWQDKGTKVTEPFQVTSKEWRIIWSTRTQGIDTDFQLYVHKSNGDLVGLINNAGGEASNELSIYEAGTFYLKVSSKYPYSITVEAKTP